MPFDPTNLEGRDRIAHIEQYMPRVYTSGQILVGPTSAAETDLINVTLPGLGPNAVARTTLIGDFINNGGASATVGLKVYAGGTKIYDATSSGVAQAATRRSLYVDLFFSNNGNPASNGLVGFVAIGSATAGTTGLSGLQGNALNAAISSGPVNIDTSSPTSYRVTWQLGTSASIVDSRFQQAVLNVIP